jgi:transcription antitermination factor NusG
MSSLSTSTVPLVNKHIGSLCHFGTVASRFGTIGGLIVMLPSSENQWFALHVRTRMEHRVSTILRAKGYEEFLPMHTTTRKHVTCQVPLFPGYLFLRVTPRACGLIVTTPGVIRIVEFGGKPAPIDPDEIRSVQLIVNSGIPVYPWQGLELGDKVFIEQGPLQGAVGIVTSFRAKQRLIVSITMMMRTVAAEVDHDWVAALTPLRLRKPALADCKMLALQQSA